jgi:putative flippase GtrA
MSELIKLALKFDLHGLLLKPNANIVIQAFRALFYGGIAFLADAIVLWILTATFGLHYQISNIISFIVGVLVNYVLAVRFVYKEKAKIAKTGEVTIYFLTAIIGLLLTAGLMWFFTDIVGLFYMISKFIAAVLVFAWNFTSRKVILYRKENN